MSLLTLQQIIQRIDRPNEIQQRLALLKPFSGQESKKVLQMYRVFNQLPVNVGSHVYSLLDSAHQAKFSQLWVKDLFDTMSAISGPQNAKYILKAGEIVQLTGVPLTPQQHQRSAKLMSSIILNEELCSQLHDVLPSVVEKTLEMSVEGLTKLGHKMHPPMAALNTRAHNVAVLLNFVQSPSADQIDHLLNWTGLSSVQSEKLDALRSWLQHHKLSTEVGEIFSHTNKRKM